MRSEEVARYFFGRLLYQGLALVGCQGARSFAGDGQLHGEVSIAHAAADRVGGLIARRGRGADYSFVADAGERLAIGGAARMVGGGDGDLEGVGRVVLVQGEGAGSFARGENVC